MSCESVLLLSRAARLPVGLVRGCELNHHQVVVVVVVSLGEMAPPTRTLQDSSVDESQLLFSHFLLPAGRTDVNVEKEETLVT